MRNDDHSTLFPPLGGNPTLKKYFCPFCYKFLFRGSVKKLKMVCPHCQEMILTDEDGLLGPNLPKTENE